MNQQKYIPNISDILFHGCEFLDIKVSETAISGMLRYLDLLRYWNSKINLTSVVGPQKIAATHFLDSLTIFKVWPLDSRAHFLDIGSGAGFPGLVLKIVDDSLSVTLLDKNPKRIVFLKLVTKELGLRGVSFINATFQDFFQNRVSNVFDVISFRALPKKSMKFLNFNKVLSSSGSIIRMYSQPYCLKEIQVKGFHEVDRWIGILPYFDLNRTVIRYQID